MKQLYTLAIVTLLLHCSAYAQSWEEVGTGSNALKANNTIWALCYDNGALYAGGQFKDTSGYYYVAKWSGVSWKQLGIGDNAMKGEAITAPICVDKDHNVYTRGRNPLNKSCVMKWNGGAWSELGTGSNALNPNNEINAICTDNHGSVYVGGAFHDGAENFNVFKWDGTLWSQLGTGGNALNANDYIMTLAADNHGNIYAAGRFTRPGNVYVAKWDGTTWHRLGYEDDLGGLSVNTLYIDKHNNVYAGGWFENAEGRPYVAKWNGSYWSEIGSGSNSLSATGPIDAITGDKEDNVYVAGTGIRESTGAFCVKKWNGINWSEVGTGSSNLNGNSQVTAICTDTSGNLYAGGNFSDGLTPYEGYKYVAKFHPPSKLKAISGMVQINAWPNPADNVLFVQGITDNDEYAICDIIGAVKKVIYIKTAGAVQTIDISGLVTGIYFLRSQNYIPFTFNKN